MTVATAIKLGCGGEREKSTVTRLPRAQPNKLLAWHIVGPGNQHGWLMIYNLQAEELQAMNKHSSKVVGFQTRM